MLYREHRSTLSESMKTSREVTCLADIGKGLSTRHYLYDARNGWNTWIITDSEGRAIGFSNGELK